MFRGGRLTFVMREHYAEFGVFKGHESSPLSLPCCGCDMVISSKIVESLDVCQTDPNEFDYVSTKGPGLDCVTMDLVENFPPGIVKDKPYAFNKGYLSDYCRFVRMLLSLPPSRGVESDIHLGVEFGYHDNGPSDNVRYKIIVYANYTTWHYLMLKKDLHPICFLLLQEFEFKVRDKGGTKAVKSSFSSVFPLSKG